MTLHAQAQESPGAPFPIAERQGSQAGVLAVARQDNGLAAAQSSVSSPGVAATGRAGFRYGAAAGGVTRTSAARMYP